MNDNVLSPILSADVGRWVEMITAPSFKTVQLALVIYVGLLWLSIIIWVTRDAIHRSESVLFQAFAILLNLVFPVLGILIYLIVRPSKTTMERYYEDLEHRLILESIQGKEGGAESSVKMLHHKLTKKASKHEASKEGTHEAHHHSES